MIGFVGINVIRFEVLADNVRKLISEIKASGLRGRGGAGFPSGMKWVWPPSIPLNVPLLINAVVYEFQRLG